MILLQATLGPFKNIGAQGNKDLSIIWVLQQCFMEVEPNESLMTLLGKTDTEKRQAQLQKPGAKNCTMVIVRCNDRHGCSS